MSKKIKRKKQKRQLPLCMIAAGMSHPAMIHVVAGFVAAVRRWDEPLPGLCLEIPNRLNGRACEARGQPCG